LLISLGWGLFLSAIYWSLMAIVYVALGIFAFDLLARGVAPAIASNRTTRQWRIPWSLPATFLFGLWAFFIQEFRLPDLSGVAFHVSHGVDGAPLADYLPTAASYLLLFGLIIAAAGHLVALRKHFRIADRLLALPLILVTPFGTSAANSLNPFFEPAFPVSTRLVKEPDLVPPEVRPNLIHLYLESVEATNEHVSSPAPIFEDLSKLGEAGLRLDGIGQAAATGFTMGGLVASQCGVPLLSLGLRSPRFFYELDSMVPGVECLGDVLDDEGYRTEFYGGAAHEFGGKGTFLRGHGYDLAWGRTEFARKFGSDAMNEWGLNDDHLFQFVFERVLELKERSEPFAISMLTLAGHPPEGFPTPRCLQELGPVRIDRHLFSIQCTGYLVREFIGKIRKTGVLDNTVVVIQSDHFAGNAAINSRADGIPRSNYFVAIGKDVQKRTISVGATMLDVYPSILDLLGFHLPDDRAGLGVSLLADSRKTLREELGAAELDRAIKADEKLRAAIWGLGEG